SSAGFKWWRSFAKPQLLIMFKTEKMKISNFKLFIAIAVTAVAFSACTKANRSDDFPAGDVPPTAGGFTASSQIAQSNLIAYWGFNGDLKESISGTTGTNHGMTFTPGLKG